MDTQREETLKQHLMVVTGPENIEVKLAKIIKELDESLEAENDNA